MGVEPVVDDRLAVELHHQSPPLEQDFPVRFHSPVGLRWPGSGAATWVKRARLLPALDALVARMVFIQELDFHPSPRDVRLVARRPRIDARVALRGQFEFQIELRNRR